MRRKKIQIRHTNNNRKPFKRRSLLNLHCGIETVHIDVEYNPIMLFSLHPSEEHTQPKLFKEIESCSAELI